MNESLREDWEIRNELEAIRIANLKVKGQVKCSDCGLFGCICQTDLSEFWNRKEFLKGKVSEVYRLSLNILNDLNRDEMVKVERCLVRLRRKLREV